MKMCDEVIDISNIQVRTVGRTVEAIAFVDQFYDEFKNLIGTQKGRVISIVDEGDEPWPTLEAYKLMENIKEKPTFLSRVRLRVLPVLKELKKRSNYRYQAKSSYIGNGKVVIWWKPVRYGEKKKAVNGIS